MASKELIVTTTLAAGSQDTVNHPQAIPTGKIWVVKDFGAVDINKGDNKSSVFILRFGTEIIRILSLTGASKEIPIKRDLIGDGSKKINVVRRNESGYDKELPFWITGYERS